MTAMMALVAIAVGALLLVPILRMLRRGDPGRCAACGDPVRPAGAYLFTAGNPEAERLMSMKPGYPCRKCGLSFCPECLQRSAIWRCPKCGSMIEPVNVRFF